MSFEVAGGPSRWAWPSHGPPGDPEGAAVPPSVVHVQCKEVDGADVASVLPLRIMGSSLDANLRWGKEGDQCVICLGAMAAGEHVSDLPGCNHTYATPKSSGRV
ncbi:hypothetical protein T484DRAFT_1762278 [Baffinella frigidus]|nr:hypothetical protein T484DRAFT_1762278 [Cryptophyta sp. CCMP2293]